MLANQHIKLHGPVLRRNKFLSILFLYVIYALAVIHTYDFQIAEANAYAGMQPWELTSAGWAILVIFLPPMAFMASRIKGDPSDFFVIFYAAIPVMSFNGADFSRQYLSSEHFSAYYLRLLYSHILIRRQVRALISSLHTTVD